MKYKECQNDAFLFTLIMILIPICFFLFCLYLKQSIQQNEKNTVRHTEIVIDINKVQIIQNQNSSNIVILNGSQSNNGYVIILR